MSVLCVVWRSVGGERCFRVEAQRHISYVFPNAKLRQPTSLTATGRGGNDHMDANTITGERALARFFDPQVIFHAQKRLHVHESWRNTTRPSIIEPMHHTQVTELSITSWNPDTLNHGKLERFLTYLDADTTKFQGTRLRMRSIPKDGESQGRHNHSGQVRMVLKRIRFFLGLEFWRIPQSCTWSAGRHPRGDFGSWTDRAEVRSAEVIGRPHGRNQGEKRANTHRSHNLWQGAHHTLAGRSEMSEVLSPTLRTSR